MTTAQSPIAFHRRSSTLGSELAAHLEQLIVAEHYPPGSPLPGERQLALELGVSRATLREALGELERKRLVVRSQGKQSMVALPDPETLAVQERMRTLRERVDHVVELENVVEPGLTRLAASRATPADSLQLGAVISRTNEHLPPEDSLALDIEFHFVLARMTRNTFLLALSGLGAERTQEVRIRAHATREARRACLEGHRAIADAIAVGDAEAAERHMREHLDTTHGYMYAGPGAEESAE